MADLLKLAQRLRAQINSVDAANLQRIAQAYGISVLRLQGDIDALSLAIDAMEKPTTAAVKALPQYKRLLRDAGGELERFTAYLEMTIASVGQDSIGIGLAHSRDLVNAAIGGGFKGLAPNALAQLLKYLQPNGPLYDRLKLLTGSAIERVVQAIADGVDSGLNPRVIARQIQDAFGGGLTDALRNVRTVQIYAYRDATLANYRASGGIVTGWIWFAQLNGACESCVAMHGTIHELDEELDDHYC